MEHYKTNELYHHGINGQKWYIRRFQNKDGSLTSEGRKRYSRKETLVSKTAEQTTTKYKNVRDMSDAELRAFIDRNTLEKQYLAAISQPKVEQGESKVQEVLKQFGSSFIKTAASKSGEAVAKKIVEIIFNADTTKTVNKK